MPFNNFGIKNKVNKVFGINNDEEEKKIAEYKAKVSKVYGNDDKISVNPFLNNRGEIFNPYIDYQKALDNPNINERAKKYITEATGLNPTVSAGSNNVEDNTDYTAVDSSFSFNANADANNLASLDVATELPKLSTGQIAEIISKHFSNSTVIKPSDAEGIYNAQKNTGMSALAILGIGALESGYGTSNIAKQKNNLWGWNATNVNPGGNATAFSPMSEGAQEFANNYMKTYYNGYGANSIYSAGTGNNPSGKGYAYYDNGSINPNWATDVGAIMGTFYNTAKSVSPVVKSNNGTTTGTKKSGNKLVDGAMAYLGTPYVWGGTTSKGFDCSGLVYHVLNQNGVKVERTTADGYFSKGTAVNKQNLQPGDLVFFKDPGASEISHIGIYAGDGMMVHASGTKEKGGSVKYTSMEKPYYQQRYAGARRM